MWDNSRRKEFAHIFFFSVCVRHSSKKSSTYLKGKIYLLFVDLNTANVQIKQNPSTSTSIRTSNITYLSTNEARETETSSTLTHQWRNIIWKHDRYFQFLISFDCFLKTNYCRVTAHIKQLTYKQPDAQHEKKNISKNLNNCRCYFLCHSGDLTTLSFSTWMFS